MQDYKNIVISGDKSISHRILIIGSLLDLRMKIKNLSLSFDVKNTIECLSLCGVSFSSENDAINIDKAKFSNPIKELNCGNSGTTARLLIGLLINKGISATISGDPSLLNRPMDRIINPLKLMNSKINSNQGHLPITIKNSKLLPINYDISVPSAQVKSCLLLAGYQLNDHEIRDKYKTRNHTEIMFNYLANFENNQISQYFIPSDISSASFIIALSIIRKGLYIKIDNLLFNPTRTGFINTLIKMNANINISNIKYMQGELTCTLESGYSENLKSVDLDCLKNTSMIDEIPIFTIVSLFSKGPTSIINARELRYKESDRISTLCLNLKNFGVRAQEMDDGFKITEKNMLHCTTIIHKNDHRIAMAFEVLLIALYGEPSYDYKKIIDISFPDFYKIIQDCIK